MFWAEDPSRDTLHAARKSDRGTHRPFDAKTIPNDAAPHSTASICRTVGTFARGPVVTRGVDDGVSDSASGICVAVAISAPEEDLERRIRPLGDRENAGLPTRIIAHILTRVGVLEHSHVRRTT